MEYCVWVTSVILGGTVIRHTKSSLFMGHLYPQNQKIVTQKIKFSSTRNFWSPYIAEHFPPKIKTVSICMRNYFLLILWPWMIAQMKMTSICIGNYSFNFFISMDNRLLYGRANLSAFGYSLNILRNICAMAVPALFRAIQMYIPESLSSVRLSRSVPFSIM